MSPRQGVKGENNPFTNQCRQKSANDAGPQQGRDRLFYLKFLIGVLTKLYLYIQKSSFTQFLGDYCHCAWLMQR